MRVTGIEESAFGCGFMRTGTWNFLSWKPHSEIKGELREAGFSVLLLSLSTPAASWTSGPRLSVPGVLSARQSSPSAKERQTYWSHL